MKIRMMEMYDAGKYFCKEIEMPYLPPIGSTIYNGVRTDCTEVTVNQYHIDSDNPNLVIAEVRGIDFRFTKMTLEQFIKEKKKAGWKT